MLEVLTLIYNGNEHTILVEYMDKEIYDIVKDNVMVFIDESVYAILDDDVKDEMPVMDDNRTPDELLNMDVLYVITNEHFDKEEFKGFVNKYKGSEHQFAELVI